MVFKKLWLRLLFNAMMLPDTTFHSPDFLDSRELWFTWNNHSRNVLRTSSCCISMKAETSSLQMKVWFQLLKCSILILIRTFLLLLSSSWYNMKKLRVLTALKSLKPLSCSDRTFIKNRIIIVANWVYVCESFSLQEN